MRQEYAIWSPVIVAELSHNRCIEYNREYNLDYEYHALEDVKIKIGEWLVQRQGQALEALVKVDILCLLEDLHGVMHLINMEETLRDRIPLVEFDPPVADEKVDNFVLEVLNLEKEGGFNHNKVVITWVIKYMVYATRQEVVKVNSSEEANIPFEKDYMEQNGKDQLIRELEEAAAHSLSENQELKRRIYIYERDLTSLKRGISKAEDRNYTLCKELSAYQVMIEQFRQAMNEKDARIVRYENYYKLKDNNHKAHLEEEDRVHLGGRLKRLFLNSI